MFDKLEIEASILDSTQQMTRERTNGDMRLGNIVLVAVKCPKTRMITKYKAQIENLHITYMYKTSTIRVSNSIHKFVKGNNYSDLTFSELCYGLGAIEELTGINIEKWRIRKMEIGFNIETKKKGTEYLPLFSTFKNKTPDKMRKDVFWYGVKWFFSEYELKIYDKTGEVKKHDRVLLNTNILRFEISINRIRKIPVIQLLSDLQNKNTLRALFDFFISEIKRIKTIESVDLSQVSKERDVEMFFAGQNELYWQHQKKINPEGVKKKRNRYLRILNEVSTRNVMNEFLEKLCGKFHKFISS